jgi:nitronate monooxygenase
MPIPDALSGLRLPIVAAPMFLVSGIELVAACCRAGIVGSFPSLNARPAAEFAVWLDRLSGELEDVKGAAPYAVNLIVHPTNERLAEDLAICERYRVPMIISSVGNPTDVAKRVHDWGGLIFHDVTNTRHARKAAEAGVDGIILVTAGAGGHAGTANPFALIAEVRQFWDGPLVLAGSIMTGAMVRAAEIAGADLAYLGTRFIATREANAHADYKQMLIDSTITDLLYTDAFSGIRANILVPSIRRAGLDPDTLQRKETIDMATYSDAEQAKAWRDIWSAGHGVTTVRDLPTTADLVDRLTLEYRAACRLPSWAGSCSRTPE